MDKLLLSSFHLAWVVVCLPLVTLAETVPEATIDPLIKDDTATYPVFVRLSGQLAGTADDYLAFKHKHRHTARSILRRQVHKDLKDRADAGYATVSPSLTKLVKSGELRHVQRHWIVSGFTAQATGHAAKQLSILKGVDYVYLRRAFHSPPSTQSPDDVTSPRFKSLAKNWVDDTDHPLSLDGLRIPWNLKKIRADKAWEKNITGKGSLIAVLDTGLQDIPAVTKALWRNPNETVDGKDADSNGKIDDLFGWDFRANQPGIVDDQFSFHGTVCAGIMVGREDREAKIITGVAPRAQFMMLRGFGNLGAYEYAAENGADIISMSYMVVGRPLGPFRGLYRTAHDHLACMGIVSVGGAGNYAKLPAGKQIGIPKDIPSVIAVAGIVESGERARASSRGPVRWDNIPFYRDYPKQQPLIKPDLTACFGGYPVWMQPSNRFAGEPGKPIVGPKGNSFSGPHAAGVAALVLDANPTLNFWQVREILESTCTDIGPKGPDTDFGAGLLNAASAVDKALNL